MRNVSRLKPIRYGCRPHSFLHNSLGGSKKNIFTKFLNPYCLIKITGIKNYKNNVEK